MTLYGFSNNQTYGTVLRMFFISGIADLPLPFLSSTFLRRLLRMVALFISLPAISTLTKKRPILAQRRLEFLNSLKEGNPQNKVRMCKPISFRISCRRDE